jgi:PAS domain S-box-containing protein/diguanylate cyclase (GGDEF)-like protein
MRQYTDLPVEAWRGIVDALPVATYLVDPNRRVLVWNDACERLTGYRREEVLGRSCANRLLQHVDGECTPKCGSACPLIETMWDGRPRVSNLILRHKAGYRIPVRVRSAPVRDEQGVIVGACEAMDERPMWLPEPPLLPPPAWLDAATELPPRAAVLERLAAEVREFGGNRVPFGVLRLEIDGFERLCADDGAIGAGRVLYVTAQTVSRLVGPGNLIGRWSAGGFLAVLRGCSESSLLASAVAIQRLAALEAVPWWGDFLTVTLSAGGTVMEAGDPVDKLIRRAESALEEAKSMGGNRAVVV